MAKANFPNNSAEKSNFYMADDWRLGILKLKKFLTCENPSITFSGATATLNLSFKGGGGEFWNIENKTVTLSQDTTMRAIYAHSDTSTLDNVTLKTFTLTESTFNIPQNETGVNVVIATIQGINLATLIWQFESHCKFRSLSRNFNLYVANDLNFECNASLRGKDAYGEVALSYLNTSTETKYYRALLSGTNHYRNSANIISAFYNFFNYPTETQISSKSVTGTDYDLALLKARCLPTETNDRYTSVETFARCQIPQNVKPIIKMETTVLPDACDFIFSNLGKNTIIFGMYK